MYLYNGEDPDDKNSRGLNILAFLIPLVGLVLFFIFNGKQPIKARGIGKWTLFGFIFGLVLTMFGL